MKPREIWLVDFEFYAPDGERPEPICLVAREIISGRLVRLWQDELDSPPWSTGGDVWFVAYYASAELGCLLALNWPMPTRIVDLYAEFRNLTNGLSTPCGSGLLGALTYFGIDAIAAAEKDSMRGLAIRGGPFTGAERAALLDYCQSDVDSLAKLWPAMQPIDTGRAFLRGRYMAAAASMEWNGVPIDMESFVELRPHWPAIKSRLVQAIDGNYGVFVPTGQRKIDPGSILGGAVLREAEAWGVDPHRFLDAVETVWQSEREAAAEHETARSEARKRTGLTANRISRVENAGRDYSTVDGFDTTARSLAGELPALGIGAGYRADDDRDSADELWQLLREPAHASKPKHHPDILNRAAELVAATPADDYCGPLTFSAAKFAEYLVRNGIPWLRLESGALDLSDDAFRQMARTYPQVAALRELRHSLSQLRLNDLAVGTDGRNRCLLSAYRARTGRNQPSNAKFIFGPSVWLRALIRPEPGRAIAYCDWEQQEFGIAAALSGDRNMQAAYSSGDPYLTFAKQAGAVPANATKATHKAERERFKVCALAVQYGMASKSLAYSIGCHEADARELLRLHRQTYPKFWDWSQAAVDQAMLHGRLWTVFGWQIRTGPEVNPRSLANFPMQGNGAEMLRLGCCLAVERGIKVCAPVHDAILVEGPADEIESVVELTQEAMREASEIVLDGFSLRTDAKIIGPGERYLDPRGEEMWGTVRGLLDELVAAEVADRDAF